MTAKTIMGIAPQRATWLAPLMKAFAKLSGRWIRRRIFAL